MIREILPDCGGQSLEQAVTMYRLWHCYDCGVQFSMKSREEPKCCPRCGEASLLWLDKEPKL